MTNIILIAAHDELNGIGFNGKLPWHVPEDLNRFKRITQHSTVVMGRKTLDSLPGPLKNRENWILSKNKHNKIGTNLHFFNTVTDILGKCEEKKITNLFIIGGQQIYETFLPFATQAEITVIAGRHDADVYFPQLNPNEWHEAKRGDLQTSVSGITFRYLSMLRTAKKTQ